MTILVTGPFRGYSENPYLNDLPREAWAIAEQLHQWRLPLYPV